MKAIFSLVIFFVVSLSAIAQHKEGFYDLRKRESDVDHARYYYVIEYKDSLWQQQVYYVPEKKLYMFGTYLDSNCKREHGRFYYKYPLGQLETTGEFNDHKKQGVWLSFHPNGAMADSSVWKNGKKIGTSLSWYENGFIQDSSIYNEDESGISLTWFDNGNPASGGRYAAGRKMNGKWQFFHYNGKLSCVETYDAGRLFQREFYDESGSPVTDTANKNQKFSFAGKEKSWSDFLAKNIDAKVPANSGAPPGIYTVMIRFSIDIDGKATDIYPLTNLGFGMEKEAIRVIKKSSWAPAIDHGRRVKSYHTQPVTFMIRGR